MSSLLVGVKCRGSRVQNVYTREIVLILGRIDLRIGKEGKEM